MGPVALFDKSFLQSLSVDESVWFGHFFLPVICPLFYVETLADLEKAVRGGRTPEQEVGIIAQKFPEQSGTPNVHHASIAMAELSGWSVPMDGRIVLAGGRRVELDGKSGVLYERSKEADAFSRWQSGSFLEIERQIAKHWRRDLQEMDLPRLRDDLKAIGIDSAKCKSLDDAYLLATSVVGGADNVIQRMGLVLAILGIPSAEQVTILQRWMLAGAPPISQYAPYAAHVVTVELFFRFSVATGQISSERASNRVDIAYLNYTPFCNVFVSSDKLHRSCAPLALRTDQEFVWGPELKADLARIDTHFRAVSEAEKEKGIMHFAHAPPKAEGSLVRRIRARYLGAGYDDQRPVLPPEDPEKMKKLVDELLRWNEEATAKSRRAADVPAVDDLDMISIERQVRPRKGSWRILSKDVSEKGSQ